MRETERERDFFKHGLVRDERDKKREKFLNTDLLEMRETERERENF